MAETNSAAPRRDSTFITRVVIKNYRSIASCDVALGPLTFLVGPNGSGKSNFLDALRFVADALNTSLDHAIRNRGGIQEVRRRSTGHPTHFLMRLDFRLLTGEVGYYEFRIGSRPAGGFEVQHEECVISRLDLSDSFRIEAGEVRGSTMGFSLPSAADRLYLVVAASLPQFRGLFDALSSMGFYNLNPDRIRDLQVPDSGVLLDRDGGNIASVVHRMQRENNGTKERIEEFLAAISPSVNGVVSRELGPKQTLEFRQNVPGAQHPWRFPTTSMSDGTLRSLGVLVALYQSSDQNAVPISLVGIEEPEVAVHPGALAVILDALRDASRRVQVIVTSHSPDLLDDAAVDIDNILAVTSPRGVTEIGPVSDSAREAVRAHLFTAGEMLRLGQLAPAQGEFLFND